MYVVSNWLLIIFSLFFLSSCVFEENSEITVSEALVTSEIVDKLQGSYLGCQPSPLYMGYYLKVAVTITGNQLVQTIDLTNSPVCATSPYYTNYFKYQIKKAAYKDKTASPSLVDLDLVSKQTIITFRHNGYIGQNYCGLTWTLNVAKDVTGISCPNLISTYDTYHTAFRADGGMYYTQIKWHQNGNIETATSYGKSGDTPDDRNNTGLLLSNKN